MGSTERVIDASVHSAWIVEKNNLSIEKITRAKVTVGQPWGWPESLGERPNLPGRLRLLEDSQTLTKNVGRQNTNLHPKYCGHTVIQHSL